MEQRGSMSPEQMQALRAQVQGAQSAQPPQPQTNQQVPPSYQQPQPQAQPVQQVAQPVQQVQPQPVQTVQPTPQRPTAQQAMMARMQASRNAAASSQSVMQQGEQYQPVNQAVANPPASPVANQTIINTTQQNDQNPQGGNVGDNSESGGGSGKGFKMNPIMAIGIVIAVLLVVFFGYSYISKNAGNGEDDSDQTYVDPINDPNIEWMVPDKFFEYTLDQKANLRAAGYTGDEIEQGETDQTPYEDLIRQAEAARDAYIQEAIAPLYDTASDEYKNFISQTWLALDERHDIEEWNLTAMNYSKRENLDYEKVGVYGNQLFVKIYLDDNEHKDWFYCLVTPDEWVKLNDYGNIIVNYTYATRVVGDDPMTSYEDTEHFFIISSSIEFVQ